MPSRAVALKLKGLERKYAELQRQVRRELQQQTQLLAKHLLLKGVCDGLSLFLGTKASVCLADGDHSDAISQQYEQRCAELQALEDELLVMLQGSSQTLAAAEAAQPQVAMDLGVQTVAPRHDPLAYFKLQLARPPAPDAGTLTSADLARLLRDTVLESSVSLHQLQTNVDVLRNDGCDTLAEIWGRYAHTAVSVILCGRPDVMEAINLYNLATLQLDPVNLAQQAARCAALPPLLNLTQQQMQEIATGGALFRELLQAVRLEQQHVQVELSAQQMTCSNSTDHSSSSLSSMQELEGHEQKTCRMQALLQKEYVLRAAACGWWVGVLSWQQLTIIHSLTWPHVPSTGLLMCEIAKYAQQQLHEPPSPPLPQEQLMQLQQTHNGQVCPLPQVWMQQQQQAESEQAQC